MIDAKKELLKILNKLNIHVTYELFLNDKTPLPCVSYMQSGDISIYNSKELSLSDVSFIIKVYGKNLTDIERISQEVDKALLGFRRIGSNELLINEIICRVLNYSVYAYER